MYWYNELTPITVFAFETMLMGKGVWEICGLQVKSILFILITIKLNFLTIYLFIESVSKAYNAADFSEIDELADDEETNETNYQRGLKFLSQDSKGMCFNVFY